MQTVRLGGMTIDKLLKTAEMFKGFKKKPSMLKQLDGKYSDAGLGMKKHGVSSATIVREIREVK